MEIVRRNTDYALRMVTSLAKHFDDGEIMSARRLADDCNFSYELGRKLLQKLHKAELVKGHMGVKGGFLLTRKPSEITLIEVINALQGGIRLNQCLVPGKGCELKRKCEISSKLSSLQHYIQEYLGDITLEDVTKRSKRKGNRQN
jgi:Rrf2 family protein